MSGECADGFLTHEAAQNAINGVLWEAYQEKIFHATFLKETGYETENRAALLDHEVGSFQKLHWLSRKNDMWE